MKRRRRLAGFSLGLTAAAIAVALVALASPLSPVGHPLTGLAEGLTDEPASDGALLLALLAVLAVGGLAGAIASQRDWGVPVALLAAGVGCVALGELGAGGMAWGLALVGAVIYSGLSQRLRRQVSNPGRRHLVRFAGMAAGAVVLAALIGIERA